MQTHLSKSIYSFPEARDRMRELLDELFKVKSSRIERIEIPLEELDLLAWLTCQTVSTKIYWSDWDQAFTSASCGISDFIKIEQASSIHKVWDRLKKTSAHPNLRYYGGFAFDPDHLDDHWKEFGISTFLLPLFELVKRSNQFFFCCNLIPDNILPKIILEQLENLKPINISSSFIPEVRKRDDQPSIDEWKRNIEGVIKEIGQDQLKKVVLTRETVFTFSQVVDPCVVLNELEKLAPHSSRFMFQLTKDVAFFGASPEKLYTRQGNTLASFAVAGTRGRGKTKEDDEKLQSELITSSKDNNEHKIVVEYIKNQLNKICDKVWGSDEPQILTLNHAYHLITKIEGQLKSHVEDQDIFSALHPTPAVCGAPKEEALKRIRQIESFSRGWFTGVVGCVGHDTATFVVAIRSALVQGNTMRVFAGAGIVKGSEAEKEWQEIDQKIENLLRVLKVK